MSRCQCESIESTFDKDTAKEELARIRKKGPARTTRWLVQAIKKRGVTGKTLLDIGGGVGAIQHQLLSCGVKTAIDVDAASAYLRTAEKEAKRLGFEGRVTYHHGNFVDLAAEIPRSDIVTLDRVICCYDDAHALVTASAKKARVVYGVVYPRDTWWGRLSVWLLNFSRRIRGDTFTVFNHPTQVVEAILAEHGFSRTFHRVTVFWQVALFERNAP